MVFWDLKKTLKGAGNVFLSRDTQLRQASTCTNSDSHLTVLLLIKSCPKSMQAGYLYARHTLLWGWQIWWLEELSSSPWALNASSQLLVKFHQRVISGQSLKGTWSFWASSDVEHHQHWESFERFGDFSIIFDEPPIISSNPRKDFGSLMLFCLGPSSPSREHLGSLCVYNITYQDYKRTILLGLRNLKFRHWQYTEYILRPKNKKAKGEWNITMWVSCGSSCFLRLFVYV